MFSKILVANRGEIAVRIIRACREMGIETVAVYSEADKNTLPPALADERICIGASPAAASYLHMRNIISAAQVTNAQAIHPGYGFLSENAAFARLCEENGIAFIGPDSRVLQSMGDKDRARRLMQSIHVPVIPGTGTVDSAEEAEKLAQSLGYPVLIKAAAGGGGKGIRAAADAEQLRELLPSASAEAESAFGDGGVFLEKYLAGVRHVEMQILADTFGNIVCLGERDCSLQKNRQKLLEEAPCPALPEPVRRDMMDTAVRAARAAGYTNAGTVEFLLAPDGRFYFIEMNARLQVEHPVTEEVCGLDLVKWQIRIAAQMPLAFRQKDIRASGCAMECRINARSTGTVDFLHAPGGTKVRFDTALVTGTPVVPYYDALLGKLIVWAPDREEAIRKMEAALCELLIQGVETNRQELLTIIRNPRFQIGEYDTCFLERGEADA